MRHKCFLPSRRFPLWWLAPPPCPPLCCGTMGVGQGCQFACGAATERNRTTGPVARWKCTPLGANAPPFPPVGGTLLYASLCANLSCSLHSAARISPSGGDAAAGGRRGAFPMWRPCRGSPSRAKLVLCLHIIGPSYELPDRCQRRGCMVFQRPSGRFVCFSRAKARLSGFYQLTKAVFYKPATKPPTTTLAPAARQSSEP